MVCQEDSSLSPEAKAPTIVQKNDEGLVEKTSGFMTAFADVLLQISKLGDRRIVSELVDLSTDTAIEQNMFKCYIKRLAYCKDVSTRKTMEVMKDDKSQRVLVRGGNGKGM